MLEKLRICWTIPELRRKILLTLGLLAIYRIGWQITMPFVDQEQIAESAKNLANGTFGSFFQKVSMFSGSQLSQATIFGLGIMPYISASIILQLMGTVYPPLEALKKEGEAGRKKINEYTRYLTVVLCVVQSYLYLRFMLMMTHVPFEQNLIADSFEIGYGGLPFSMANHRRPNHDLRFSVPHVVGRANR